MKQKMINKKLSSENGSTLLFSLVALAIAVIVCAVVIYAAQSSTGRIKSAQADEQVQLSLNSAASVVREMLAGNGIKMTSSYTSVTHTENGVSTTTKTQGDVTIEYSDTSPSNVKTVLASGKMGETATTNGLTGLQKVILQWALDVMNDSATSTNSCYREYIIKASGPDGDLEDINMKIRLEPGATTDLDSQDKKDSHEAEKYYLTIVFTSSTKPSEAITMSFMASISESTSSKLLSKTSGYEQDVNGNMISVSDKTVETQKVLELIWPEASVVVNIADKDGGLT